MLAFLHETPNYRECAFFEFCRTGTRLSPTSTTSRVLLCGPCSRQPWPTNTVKGDGTIFFGDPPPRQGIDKRTRLHPFLRKIGGGRTECCSSCSRDSRKFEVPFFPSLFSTRRLACTIFPSLSLTH